MKKVNSKKRRSCLRSNKARKVLQSGRPVEIWGSAKRFIFNLKKKYRGLWMTELRRLHKIEEDNVKLKKLVADISPDQQMLQEVLKKI